jgi:hypothetical protein
MSQGTRGEVIGFQYQTKMEATTSRPAIVEEEEESNRYQPYPRGSQEMAGAKAVRRQPPKALVGQSVEERSQLPATTLLARPCRNWCGGCCACLM